MPKYMIRIDQIDPLFFRNPKPFSMGEENFAEIVRGEIFPLRTVYGAIRGLYWSNHPSDIHRIYKDLGSDPTADFEITRVMYFYKRDEHHVEYLLPLPSDVYYVKKSAKAEKRYRIAVLKEVNSISYLSPKELTHTLFFEEEGEPLESKIFHMIPFYALRNYLFDLKQSEVVVKEVKRFMEPKIGLKIDRATRTAEEGHLYSAVHVRYFVIPGRFEKIEDLRKLGVLLWIDTGNVDLLDPDSGDRCVVKLGGEARFAQAYIERVESGGDPSPQFEYQDLLRPKDEAVFQEEVSFFKLYFATPVCFEDGDGVLNGALKKEVEEALNSKVEIAAVAFDKPFYLGGFDMVLKKPKEVNRVVPAGAIYVFKLERPMRFGAVFERLNAQRFGCNQFKKEGYGIAYVGKVRMVKEA